MNVSLFISRLQKLQDHYGDIEVQLSKSWICKPPYFSVKPGIRISSGGGPGGVFAITVCPQNPVGLCPVCNESFSHVSDPDEALDYNEECNHA